MWFRRPKHLVPKKVRRTIHNRVFCDSVAEPNSGRRPMSEPQSSPQVQIKADEKELLGQYSNLVMIHHNPEEFTLHFVYLFTNGTHGKLVSSVIVSPGHAKRLWRARGKNISRYEAQFGEIREAPAPAPPSNVGFVQ